MKSKFLLWLLLLPINLSAQHITPRMHLGMNLGGINDWMTEMPFGNVMHQCRQWMTHNSALVGGGTNEWDTGFASQIPVDSNGYPLKLPLSFAGAETTQIVQTIFADISAWPEGKYTVLYDGNGSLNFSGNMSVVTSSSGRLELQYNPPAQGTPILIMQIAKSDSANHLRNIRILMPGSEATYTSMPYYQPWFDHLRKFRAVRFMDWGATNNWGTGTAVVTDADSIRVPWSARASTTHYTWATNKGVPYEVMIDLCNRLDEDMWVCVPHRADDDYIRQLATLIKSSLKPNLKVLVEYGNENWNWMFGQTQWLYRFGCLKKGVSWPEGIVPYIQNCMDIFADVFAGEMNRLVRVVGVQAAWQDVSNRIVFNMRKGSVDVFSPAAYFGLSAHADTVLDALGAAATSADVAALAASGREANEKPWLRSQKSSIADSLHIPMFFYEGGQHLTPSPFGVEPTYAQALLDIQRDNAMADLYAGWFNFLDTLSASTTSPPLFMVFSFVGSRSARYGSWGMLESITQDTSAVPAPKYRAIMDYLRRSTTGVPSATPVVPRSVTLEQNFPNPFNPTTKIGFGVSGLGSSWVRLAVYDLLGREVALLVNEKKEPGSYQVQFNGTRLSSGVYFCRLQAGESVATRRLMLLR